MSTIKFYDTNALLLLQNKVFEEPFYVSAVSLYELENIKVSGNKDDKTKYKARNIVRLLNQNEDKYNVIVPDLWDTSKSPDELICQCATKIDGVIFVTNDLCCKAIANKIYNLKVESVGDVSEDIYKGYKTITGNTEVINFTMENIDYSEWNLNEYLIIENTDDGTIKEMRYDGEKFVALKLPPSKYIKAKNSLQRCALDILMNPDITIAAILGSYGCGKSALTTKMALYAVKEKGHQSEIHVVRNPIGEGESVGWLKGDFEDKTEQFFLPFVQQLDGGMFEMESLKQQGVIEAHIPYYCKGLTFNNSVIVVDEAEDLSEKEIKLIGTRIGCNSRIFMNGDYKQSIHNASDMNPLIKMCNELKGNPMFATIYLGEDVRSETSKLFANIFE